MVIPFGIPCLLAPGFRWVSLSQGSSTTECCRTEGQFRLKGTSGVSRTTQGLLRASWAAQGFVSLDIEHPSCRKAVSKARAFQAAL